MDPWDLQPGETPKSYAAFILYRDMGPTRSLTKLVAIPGEDGTDKARWRNVLGSWSSSFRWVERCAAWDRELDRQRRQAVIDDVRETAVQQSRMISSGLEKAMKRLDSFSPDELDPRTLLAWMTDLIKLQRQIKGMDAKQTEEKPDAPDAARTRLARLMAVLDAAAAPGPTGPDGTRGDTSDGGSAGGSGSTPVDAVE